MDEARSTPSPAACRPAVAVIGVTPVQELFAQLLVAEEDAERRARDAAMTRARDAEKYAAAEMQIARQAARIEALEAELAAQRRNPACAWPVSRIFARLLRSPR